MIQDKLLILSDGQAETTQAAHDSDNVIDLYIGTDELGNAVASNPGEGGQLWLNVVVGTAFTTGSSATLAVALQDSADNSSWAAVSPTVGVAATAAASLTAGTVLIRQPLHPNLARYIKLVYTIGTGTMTAGAIDAWISHGPADSRLGKGL